MAVDLKIAASTEFKVVSNIPYPGPHRPKYPWKEMEVGQSFLFPQSMPVTSASARASAAGKDGRKFRVGKTPDGYRCWRTA